MVILEAKSRAASDVSGERNEVVRSDQAGSLRPGLLTFVSAPGLDLSLSLSLSHPVLRRKTKDQKCSNDGLIGIEKRQ